jgi:hypothetical protein
MTRILVVLGLAALFAGGALAASSVPKLPVLGAAEQTTSAATTTTGTTATGATTTATTSTATSSTSETGETKAHKIVLCHKPDKRGGHEIEVSRSALPAHQAHGDTEGPCASTATTATTTTSESKSRANHKQKAKQSEGRSNKGKGQGKGNSGHEGGGGKK